MERKIEREQVKLYILCSPQNPTGRVWTREELSRVGEICLRHGVKVVSDEIHFDITYPGHEHSVFASISEELAANSVVLTAPSKTFNIAGMTISNVVISNPELRERVKATWRATMGGYFNSFGYAALRGRLQERRALARRVPEGARGQLPPLHGLPRRARAGVLLPHAGGHLPRLDGRPPLPG